MAAMYTDAAGHSYKAYTQEEEPEFTSCIRGKSPINPEAACWCSTQEDFIIFAEFSEITGPIPLVTIPAYIENNVNINALIMSIMSLDYQGNTGGQFVLCEDAQVLRSDVLPGLHVYAHYTTLNDLKARGFVRPLCIAYVSPDRLKLDAELINIREYFLQITKLMKCDNRQWFLSEISQVLDTLQEAKTRYFELKRKQESDSTGLRERNEEKNDSARLSEKELKELSEIDLAQLVVQSSEYQHMSHLVEYHLEADKTVLSELECWGAGLETHDRSQVTVYLSKVCSERKRERVGRGVLAEAPALCPRGIATALWRLMGALQRFGYCRLEVPLNMFPQEEPQVDEKPVAQQVEEALDNIDFLQLLYNMATVFDVAVRSPVSPRESIDGDSFKASTENIVQDALYFTDKSYYVSVTPGQLQSGTEGSSSYYSVAESMAGDSEHSEETLPAEGEGCPSDNSWSYDEEEEAHVDMEVTPQPVCIWGQQSFLSQPGHRILKFFQSYEKVALHVVYSILIGRTIVVCGGSSARRRASQIITALMALVPLGPGKHLKVLRWHCGILVASHVIECQLIGLCVPERLSVYDMMGHREKNRVAILSMKDGQLFGPAYRGRLLSSLDSIPQRQPCDQGLLLYLRVISMTLQEKLFVFRTLAGTRPDPTRARSILREMELEGCDAEIICYLDTILPEVEIV